MRFTCTYCGKAYARTEHLKRHIQSTHQSSQADEAPRVYPCDVPGCEKTFRRSDVLARHKRGHGLDEAPASKKIKRSSTSSPSNLAGPSSQSSLFADTHSFDMGKDSNQAVQGLTAADYAPSSTRAAPQSVDGTSNLSETSHSVAIRSAPIGGSGQMPSYLSPSNDQSAAMLDTSTFRQPTVQPLTSRALQEQQQLAGIDLSLARSNGLLLGDSPARATNGNASRNINAFGYPEYSLSAMTSAYANFQNSSRNMTGSGDGSARQRTSATDLALAFDGWDPQYFAQQVGENPVPRLGWDNINDKNLSGLDWIFDDGAASLTDASVFSGGAFPSFEEDFGMLDDYGPKPPDSLSRATEKIFERAKGSTGETDPFESLGLINLANTAIDQANGNGNGKATRNGKVPDDGGDWPRDFRPTRRQPPTLEISEYVLAVEMEDKSAPQDTSVDRKSSEVAQQASRHIPFVLIEEFSDFSDTNGPTPHSYSSDSRFFETAATRHPEPFIKISETARQHLLEYLRHSCKHPWSVYSFNGKADSFLTCPELETLVSLYFRKVHPYTPILHLPTFDPDTASPVLLLIVATKGLVFYVSEMQARGARSASLAKLQKRVNLLGPAFSELTRIGTMSAFEADQRGFLDISINQAWLLQQLFGIGSGNKRLYKLAERNRGGIMTAIRRMGLLNMPSLRLDIADQLDYMDKEALERRWRTWVDHESRIRLAWFVFLYDQLYGLYMDISPMILYTEVTSPFPCDEQLWNARSAQEWYNRVVNQPQASPKPSFIDVLRKLLDPPRHKDVPLRLNRLEAYILAVTLYRIRWDTSRRSLLFGMEAFAHSEDVTLGEDNVVHSASGTVAIDAAAANALQGLFEAASSATHVLTTSKAAKRSRTSLTPPSLALSIDVQLLRLLSKMHFSGPPAFFDMLKDAGGRAGNARRGDAVLKLQRWVTDQKNHVSMRHMLLASARIYDLIRTSLDATAANPDIMVLQSHVCIVSLFHSALIMWAYEKFGPRPPRHQRIRRTEHRETPSSADGNADDAVWINRSVAINLPCLSPFQLRSAEESGVVDLVGPSADSPKGTDGSEDWPERASESTNGSISTSASNLSDTSAAERVVEAWSYGAYRSSIDGKIRRWPAASELTVRIAGIGELKTGPRPGLDHGQEGMVADGMRSVPTVSHAPSETGREADEADGGRRRESGEASEQITPERPEVLQPENNAVQTSRILLRFASLLRRLDWGLAASFRTILIHMARHETRSAEAAESSR